MICPFNPFSSAGNLWSTSSDDEAVHPGILFFREMQQFTMDKDMGGRRVVLPSGCGSIISLRGKIERYHDWFNLHLRQSLVQFFSEQICDVERPLDSASDSTGHSLLLLFIVKEEHEDGTNTESSYITSELHPMSMREMVWEFRVTLSVDIFRRSLWTEDKRNYFRS